jgi:hypothetical protein
MPDEFAFFFGAKKFFWNNYGTELGDEVRFILIIAIC